MNAIQKTICAGLVLASMAGGAPLRAEDIQRESAIEINKANGLLRGGNVDGAIGAYQQVRELAPESADLSYNMAVAQYRKGDVAAAEGLFQAVATSENDTLAARSRFNLGNCDYTAGLQLAEKDRPAAIEKLESAITNYRSALAVDGTDADARTNIELAAQLIDKLREEQKQQEQQQNQQQQQQDQQQQSSDEQQQKGQQGQQDKQQQDNKDQKQSNQKQDEQQKNDQQQQSQGDKGQEEQSKQEQQSAKDEQQQKQDEKSKEEKSKQEKSQSQQQSDQEAGKENQQPQQSQSKPSPQQQKANQSPQQNPPSPADESPEKQGKAAPKGELNAAEKEDAKDAKQQEQEVAAFDPAKDGEMTKQEAEKMLQAIRDRDMLRRLRREATERSQYEPVDRDW